MARLTKTGGKTSKVKARKVSPTKGHKSVKTKRRIAVAARHHRRQSVSELIKELNEAREQQTATAEILKVINTSKGDLTQVFDTILEKAHHLCDVTSGSLQLFDGEYTRAVAVRGMTEPFEQYLRQGYRVTTSVRQYADPDRVIQHIDLLDVLAQVPDEAALRAAVDLGGIRSFLAVPLVKDGTVLGRIVAARKKVQPFTDKQIALLESFAAQAAIAIENARLFNETKQALARQTATSEILRVISQSPTDVRPVFDAIVLTAVRLFRCDLSFVMLCDHTNFWVAAAATPEGLFDDLTLVKEPIDPYANFPSRAIVGKQLLYLPDWSLVDLPEHERQIHEKIGVNSALYLPLLREGDCIGLLTVGGKRPGSFGESEIALAESFRDQALIAIENTRLFDEVQAKTRDLTESLQQQTATAEVLKVISRSAFDLDVVLNSLTKSAVELCNSTYGAISLYRDGVLVFMAQTGCTPEFAELLWSNPARLDRKSVTGRTGLLRTIVQVPDVMLDEDYDYHGGEVIGNYRSISGVPLLRNGELEGVFTLMRREPGNFTPRQIELVQTFADQAVIAIENVRLFDEVQARTKELAASLDELRTAQDRLVQTEKLASLGQLTAGIAHEIKNPLNFVNNFSALSAELVDEMKDVLSEIHLDGNKRKELDEITQILKTNLEKVVQHGKRADSIVKNMLQHSREGSGEHRPTDINAIVDESLNLAYHGARAEKAGFSIAFQRDLDPSVGMVDVYPQEITRVLLNLITNGFYATAKRGTEAGDGYEPTLFAATKNLGNNIEIRIRDNGTGIPEEVKEKIFNPFFTTKPSGEGTGLGLSMSHDIIVKQHGGTIDVETEPGLFTEFKIVLPRTSQR